MSVEERNKALVRRFVEAYAKSDLQSLDELLALGYVDHSPFPGQKPDREDYMRAVAEDQGAFSDSHIIIEDQAADGDRVISRLTMRGTHDRSEFMGVAPTGRVWETTAIVIHRVVRGKIVEEWSESRNVLEATRQRLEQEIRERERVRQELQVARHIQQASLPKEVPELEGWEIAPHYLPAREVGGDFYDFFELANGNLGLVVGDATGKGVPAALVMATTCGMLGAVSLSLDSPGQVLERVNEALYARIPANMFVTCFYAILDPQRGLLRYANAGHDLPYLRHGGGAEELRARGVPLGLMPGMGYEEKEIVVEAGASILFYSDGLVEAHDPQREMFGFPRLRALIGEQDEEHSLVDSLLRELRSFTGEGWEQEDDITLLTLRRHSADCS